MFTEYRDYEELTVIGKLIQKYIEGQFARAEDAKAAKADTWDFYTTPFQLANAAMAAIILTLCTDDREWSDFQRFVETLRANWDRR